MTGQTALTEFTLRAVEALVAQFGASGTHGVPVTAAVLRAVRPSETVVADAAVIGWPRAVAVYAGGIASPRAANLAVALEAGVALAAVALAVCLLYTSPSPRDLSTSRMPSSA